MRKATRRTKLYVGAFVASFLALLAAGILFFGDDLDLFKKKSQYYATFENAAGLQPGAPVKMGGVAIGTVQAITISTEASVPKILATLSIIAPHDSLVKVDSQVSLATSGVLGDKFVTLSPGDSSSASVPPGSFIKTKEKTELGAVVQKSTAIVDSVSTTADKVEKFVASLPKEDAMVTMTGDLEGTLREMHSLVEALRRRDSVLGVISNEKSGEKLERTLDQLQTASSHLASIAKKIDEGRGTLGALVNDPSLYDDMRTLLGRANRSKTARFIIQQTLRSAEEQDDAK